MQHRTVWATVLLGTCFSAATASAECLGSCAQALEGALLALLGYGILGIVLLVMLIRAKWRRAGVRLLIASALLAVGLPMVSQAWAAWKLRGMEAREVAGTLPDLQGKVLLLVFDRAEACYYNPCGLALSGRGAAGVYGLPLDALEGLETGKPLALADLPLELWQAASDGTSSTTARILTVEERKIAAGRIDYVMVLAKPWYADTPDPAEAGLRQRVDLAGLGAGERVNLALGPVSGGVLDLGGMPLDLIDLWLDWRPLALILAPYNRQDPGNSMAGFDALEAALCTKAATAQGVDCDYALRP